MRREIPRRIEDPEGLPRSTVEARRQSPQKTRRVAPARGRGEVCFRRPVVPGSEGRDAEVIAEDRVAIPGRLAGPNTWQNAATMALESGTDSWLAGSQWVVAPPGTRRRRTSRKYSRC